MKIKFALLFFLLASLFTKAQQITIPKTARYTISGYVKDSLNGESLIGATVSVKGKSKGINSNQFGFYSITLAEGTYELVCTYVGFQPRTIEIKLDHDVRMNFDVMPVISLSEAVVVTSKKRDANVKNAQLGKITLPIEQINIKPSYICNNILELVSYATSKN